MKKLFKRERRKFLRVGTYHLLRYLRYGTAGTSYPILSISRNIGGGGLMFVTKDKLGMGDKIELELNFPPFGEPIKAIAQVIYITKKERTDNWQVGARFIELGDPTLDRILDYVDYINKTVKKRKKV